MALSEASPLPRRWRWQKALYKVSLPLSAPVARLPLSVSRAAGGAAAAGSRHDQIGIRTPQRTRSEACIGHRALRRGKTLGGIARLSRHGLVGTARIETIDEHLFPPLSHRSMGCSGCVVSHFYLTEAASTCGLRNSPTRAALRRSCIPATVQSSI